MDHRTYMCKTIREIVESCEPGDQDIIKGWNTLEMQLISEVLDDDLDPNTIPNFLWDDILRFSIGLTNRYR